MAAEEVSVGDLPELVDTNSIDDQEDVLEGYEPGASSNAMLVTNDSYEDLSQNLKERFDVYKKTRHASGNINEIDFKETHQHNIEKKTLEDELNNLNIEDDTFHSSETNDNPNVPAFATESEEDMHSLEWKKHKKHVFILSEAGKPIYTRYGNEDKLVTLMGVMQALVSFVQDNKDNIRSIVAGKHKFVFLIRGPVILVAVACSKESVQQLIIQLTYVYNQILNVLTFSQLNRIFEKRQNYDLRRLLAGAEKFIDNLLCLMDHEPSFLLGAVRCLPLSSSIRDIISQSIVQNCNKIKNLVFAILVADNQLITLVRMKKYCIHPADLHIIFNLVHASESFKAAESWTPVCLPKFDSSGFLHAHVSYLDDNCSACLLLLTVDRDAFHVLSTSRKKIVERLKKYDCLKAINESIVAKESYRVAQVGIPDLRHFMYKSKSTAQYTSPGFEVPYLKKEEQERLFGFYQYVHHRVHSLSRPLKILYYVGEKETMLGWVTSGFELYATFGPLVTKPVIISAVHKLLRWIKKEEDRLFILNSPVF